MPGPTGIRPQWPRVVTAPGSQFPSNWAAIAGGAEQMIAKAVHKANSRVRLPIMEDLMRVVLKPPMTQPRGQCHRVHKRSPGERGAHRGFGFRFGGTV